MATHGGLFVRPYLALALPVLMIGLGASMSLVGLLPPLCNNGGMLVDGGYGLSLSLFTSLPYLTSNQLITYPCAKPSIVGRIRLTIRD
jgi:hypothetical protein